MKKNTQKWKPTVWQNCKGAGYERERFENYQVSIGALTALQKYGVRVPQEVKIVGIDEIPDYICPDMCLTQMKIPHTERAIMAMDLLDKEIRYSWTVKVNIYAETEMIVR